MIIAPTRRLQTPEFIALLAMLMATVAFSIDAMLPALPDIATALTPDAPDRAQLIVTSFVLGLGLGTFFSGPLSDRFGRRAVMLGGAALYIVGTLIAWRAQSLGVMLAGRVVMGLGAAGPRVAVVALVRDLYSGAQMARIMSFVFMIFALFPAVAPAVGYGIIAIWDWRGIFLVFVGFSLVASLWFLLRQPETLPPEHRRPLSARRIFGAVAEVLSHRTVVLSILVQTCIMGMLFVTVSTIQPVFDRSYGRAEDFHLWFFAMALIASSGSFLNSRIVVRLGMRPIIRAALLVSTGLTLVMIAALLLPLGPVAEFAVYYLWVQVLFLQLGLTMGNLNALAMEPLGHVAGLAASVITALSTVGAAIIAAPIGLTFDGTPLPLAIGILVLSLAAYLLTRGIQRPGE